MFPWGESFSLEKEKEWPSDPALAIAKYLLPGVWGEIREDMKT